jgi:enamine deaminase RidA (YjgF/YER057c/UK114 family)
LAIFFGSSRSDSGIQPNPDPNPICASGESWASFMRYQQGAHMAGKIETRLSELALELPKAATPVGNYVAYVVTGNLVFVSGQLPLVNGELKYKGKVGADVSLEDAQAAARACALNLVAQVRAACGGSLDRVRRVVKLCGFVNSNADFTQQANVINGASDLLVQIFGEAGKHARAAVSCPALPLGAAVEIDAVFEIER